MLGGACRDRIRAYASVLHLSGASVVEDARNVVRAGFSALKPDVHPRDYGALPTQALLTQSVERVRALREAIGYEVDLCLEYHGISFSPTDGVRLARALEPFDPFFLEEPALTENPMSVAEVKSKTSIPIAGGERCVTPDSMRALMEKRAVDIIQPEPTANGGILQTIKLAGMAELYHITLAPHQTGSPVSLAVCCHIDAVVPNFLIQEFNVVNSSCVRDLFGAVPAVEDGYLSLPEGPGLGIELNEEAASAYGHTPFDRRVIVQADGSIGL
jgi:galactonate dehydratase